MGMEAEDDKWSREEGCEKSEVWLSIGIHACGNNGDKLMDQVVAGLMGGNVRNG